jgi:D-3-phosphoglycerate dehydrogenase
MQINNIDVGLLDMSSPMSDVLTVHLPLTDETRGLVGADILASTKYLINTSRGELVDEDALLEALVSGKLAGAALDVMAGERGPFMGLYGSYGLENLPLLCYARENQNLILTPHIAGATHEAMAATEVFMAKKLVAWLNA